MNYIVFDLEFNQSFDFHNGFKTQLVAECPFEIIQIGAVKLNARFEVICTADFLIRPKLYTVLHPYVKKITALSMDTLKQMPYFPDVYKQFVDFVINGGEDYLFCTWGGADIAALNRNAAYYNLDTELFNKKYINVQELASKKLQKPHGMYIGLENAVREFGLDDSMSFHYALNDALYTAMILGLCKAKH